jgi:hypothetical protein
VISNNYNEFDTALYVLFVHHLETNKVPRAIINLFYYSVSENRRLDYIKQVFASYESDQKVISCVDAIIRHFQWCAETRNTLIHAKYEPPSFYEYKEEALYLSKRRKDPEKITLNYMKLSLLHLRRIADQIQKGQQCCIQLNSFLFVRAYGSQLNEAALKLLEPLSSLPEVPPPPKRLKLSQTPHNPVVRDALRRSRKAQ